MRTLANIKKKKIMRILKFKIFQLDIKKNIAAFFSCVANINIFDCEVEYFDFASCYKYTHIYMHVRTPRATCSARNRAIFHGRSDKTVAETGRRGTSPRPLNPAGSHVDGE